MTTYNDGAKCKDLRPILKEIDPLFDISFNYETESYSIYFNGYLFRTVPYGEFTRETFEDIRETVWININGDPFKEVDEANEAADKRTERQREDLSYNLANDIRKPLLRELRGA
jgi:hypothetical protein